MSPLLTSQGMVLATAMAVSGTVILFLCRQKHFSLPQPLLDQTPTPPSRNLRSCISSNGRKKKENKKKKRVHFADVVVHHLPTITRDNEENEGEESSLDSDSEPVWVSVDRHIPRIPANRMALYHGILQDRLQRMACSY